MSKGMEGATNFFPITYKSDWEVVRNVAESAGEKFTQENLKNMK
jgi:phosphonate transport system substrate-binding protein